jgi:hypothetical protein
MATGIPEMVVRTGYDLKPANERRFSFNMQQRTLQYELLDPHGGEMAETRRVGSRAKSR